MPRQADPHARAALLSSARAEFAQRGLRGARVEDITSACGLSKGAFYLHFTSKDSLFAALVRKFEKGMDELSRERREQMDRFLADGPLTPADVERRSPRYQRLVELEENADLNGLTLMWEFREVVAVLMSGAQGTKFEGSLFKLTDAEVDRVAREVRMHQQQGTCRTDIPPEMFGAMIVGTHLLLAHRLCKLTEKPDLRSWARSLQALVRYGSSPAGLSPNELVASVAGKSTTASKRLPLARKKPLPRSKRGRATSQRSTP